MGIRSLRLGALAVAWSCACNGHRAVEPDAPRRGPDASSTAPTSSTAFAAPPSALSPATGPTAHASLGRYVFPSPRRLVAVGDLHGDLDHARRALRLARAIDTSDRWVGGDLVVVQTGDEIDRGDDDRAILDDVERWRAQARAAGGDVVALLGNHELMNAMHDFRYVTTGGFEAFSTFAGSDAGGETGRAAAFAPDGPYARVLGHRPVVVQVGDSVFVHGGVLPEHVRYGLERMNDEVDAWLEGAPGARVPAPLVAEDGPVWTRVYSLNADADACARLRQTLAALGAERMVVGHTVQRDGITSACEEHVWRIDVGLSRAFGGPIQVLQIQDGRVTVLREP
jgi:hypothetical protein